VTLLLNVLTFVAYGLEVLLLVLAIRKKLFSTLIFLALYIYLLFARETVWLYIAHSHYFLSHWAAYFYYISDVILTALRLLVIVEIGIRTLQGYPFVWHFAWRLLALMGLILILWGAHSALRDAHSFQQLILTIRQFLNSTQAVLLLVILVIGLYYRIDVPHLYRSIVIGVCIFSAVQIFNSELGRYFRDPRNTAFDDIYRSSFVIMEVVWVKALWLWSGDPLRPRQLISQGQYDELSPQIHDRLRELNDRLAGLKNEGNRRNRKS
jgi:hypothetical protein